jgi:RimJ/RimL family protein N-acetyltransferase
VTDSPKIKPVNHIDISVRRCREDDVYDVWVWWNDPVTRSMMANKTFVPFDQHVQWFNSVLRDTGRVLCMGLINEERIGVIRFDARDQGKSRWEVSINLSPAFRGRDLGWRFLVSAISFFANELDFSTLYANVGEASNIPSQRTFLKAGFRAIYDPNHQFHYELQRPFY